MSLVIPGLYISPLVNAWWATTLLQSMASHTSESSVTMEPASSTASTLNEPFPFEAEKLASSTKYEAPVPADEKVGPGESLAPREVTWDGDNDPENPRNWPQWKKWYPSPC